MNVLDVFKVSGSHSASVLSATTLAVTMTMSPPLSRGEVDSPKPIGHAIAAPVPTDRAFVLAQRPDEAEDAIINGYSELNATALQPWPFAIPSPFSVESAVAVAAEFYAAIPSEVQSQLLWEIISLGFMANSPTPVVQSVEDFVTVDYSSPGHLVSIMIDKETCNLSSFSRNKELKMSYVIDEQAAREDLTEVIWTQLKACKNVRSH